MAASIQAMRIIVCRAWSRLWGAPGVEWTAFALIAIGILGAVLALAPREGTLRFSLHVEHAGAFQVYFSDDGAFSEFDSIVWPAGAADRSVDLSLRLEDARYLRLDPAPEVVAATLCGLRLDIPGGVLVLTSPDVKPAHEIRVEPHGACVRLINVPGAQDPHAVVDLSQEIARRVDPAVRWKRAAAWLVIVALGAVLAAFRLCAGNLDDRLVQSLGKLDAALPGLYLAGALVLGTLYAVITPPGAAPDEPAHAAKTILVANGTWRGSSPSLSPGLSQVMGPFDGFLDRTTRFAPSTLIAHAGSPLSCEPKAESYPATAVGYAPLMYIPGAVALVVSCATAADVGAFWYGGRLGNLLLSVVLVYVGLRAAGRAKWPLFAVAMMPMVLFEQASLTADSLILGLSFGLIGVQAGLTCGHLKPGFRSEWLLVVLGVGLAFTKPGYAWVCAGFLFSLPAYRAAGRSWLQPALMVVGVPWMLHIAWSLSTAGAAVARPDVDVHVNLQRLWTEPQAVLSLLRSTFFGEGSAFLWSSMVGRLGWLDVPLDRSIYALAATMLACSLALGWSDGLRARWVRPMAIVLAVGAAMLPVIPMYLYWTPAGALAIEGLQGRYFLPAAAFLLVWCAWHAKPVLRAPLMLAVLGAAVALNADGILQLAGRYYV